MAKAAPTVTEMTTTLENGILTIMIPVSNSFPESATGKTRRVASSEGNKKTGVKVKGHDGNEHEIVVGLNAYYKP